MFDQITILGPGLLGASLAMAAKANGLAGAVHVWSRRQESRTEAAKNNWCDAVFDTPEAACEGSNLIVICTPVETITALLQTITPQMSKGIIVTDVGSTKATICQIASELDLNGAEFIGSHPMAGSEKTGMAHATAELFSDAACIVTPTDSTAADALQSLCSFWEGLGMRVTQTTAEVHDNIVAHVSHLPHLLASSLACYLGETESALPALSGGGLRDTTRVAGGDPELWRQILEQNRAEVLCAIDGFEEKIQQFKIALKENQSDQLTELLKQGKLFRDTLNNHN